MPAKFDLRIEPTNYFRVPPGTLVEFDVVVKNIGDNPGDYEVWISYLSGDLIIEGRIGSGTLNPGEEARHHQSFYAELPPQQPSQPVLSATSIPSSTRRYEYYVLNITEGGIDDRETVTVYVGVPWAKIVSAPSKVECILTRKCSIDVVVKNIGTLEYNTIVRLEDQYGNVWAETKSFLDIDEQKTFTLEFITPSMPDIERFYIRTYTWQNSPDDEKEIEIIFTTGIPVYDLIIPVMAYVLTYIAQLLIWYILKKVIDKYVKLMWEAEKIYGI